jgi:hypothetical protein
MEVVDGVQRMVFYVPAKCTEAAADIQPRHHDTCERVIEHKVLREQKPRLSARSSCTRVGQDVRSCVTVA